MNEIATIQEAFQGEKAIIKGRVLDSQGKAIKGAELKNPTTKKTARGVAKSFSFFLLCFMPNPKQRRRDARRISHSGAYRS